jgi:hypothetical protein
MRRLRSLLLSACILSALFPSDSAADSNDSIRWRTIVGILQAGNVVAGIAGGGQPWTALGGDARVDLRRGEVEFEIRGLVLAGGNAIGTRGTVDQVMGTLVCAVSTAAVKIDTPLVPLSVRGDAKFEGDLGPLPLACSQGDVAFLVRIAAGRWIANGAVRIP